MASTPEILVHAPEDAMGENEKQLEPTPSLVAELASSYPAHPIAQLQGPFEESIVETSDNTENTWAVEIDAQERRRDLLENEQYERLCGRKWRQRTSEK
jgi:hypothetical protein